MRILIAGPSIYRSKGGMATVISDQLADKILNCDHQLKYLTTHVEGSFIEKIGYSLKSALHILYKRKNYDIVHFHTAADASFYRKSVLLWLSAWLGLKTIIHIHGSDFDSFYLNRGKLLKRYIAGTLAKSDKVLVLSEYWKNFFNKEFGNLNIKVLANGIDPSSFAAHVRRPVQFKKFLFLGRLGERKGTYDLLAAINILVHTKQKNELTFYLAGDGEIEKIREQVVKYNLAANVKILGWLDNAQKRDMLKIADAVVLPSYDENLPMSLIEAMACGKVIISTITGGIPDLVKQGVNGFLLKPGDVDQLVQYILLLNEHADTVRPMAQTNIDAITQQYNLAGINKELSAIYSNL